MVDIKCLKKTPFKLYKLGKDFLDVIKSKTPKIIIEEKNATCMLMRNTPFPNFEANFINGVRVMYQVGSEVFTIFTEGREIQVNPYLDIKSLNLDLSLILETTMEGLKKCLNKERESY